MASELTATRRLKKVGIRLLAVVAPVVYLAYMRFVYLTSRVDTVALDELTRRRDAGDNVVAAILHQDIFLVPYVLRELGALAFTNVGDAGDLMTALLESCNYRVVRGGTSSRTSRQTPVLAQVLNAVKSRSDGLGTVVGSAPDGSSGPAGAINAGLVLFSMRLDADVYCVRIQAKRALYLKTWDRTTIPLPFGEIRGELRGPFRINGKPTSERMEATRLDIENAFHELHAEGFRRFGREPVPQLSRMPPRRPHGRVQQENAG
jgi:lysophospholipid acyltransferase (LPLAT)-like uncharacterized protein